MLTYDWVDTKVAAISSALSSEAALRPTDIVVGDPFEWLALLVQGDKRICRSLMTAWSCFTGASLYG